MASFDAYDRCVVPKKEPNKVTKHHAEALEGRQLTKENVMQTTVAQTQSWISTSNGLQRVREKLTVYPVSTAMLRQTTSGEFQLLQDALLCHTYFGIGAKHEGKIEHPILDKSNWQSTELTRRLRDKAIYQIGTSGTGNHFVEWGEMEITEENNPLHLAKGVLYLTKCTHLSQLSTFCGIYPENSPEIPRKQNFLGSIHRLLTNF